MENSLTNLLGVVMCGGKSSRMNSDKGLLLKDGKTWTQLALSKLSLFTSASIISINPDQAEVYAGLFPHNNLLIDSISSAGPLTGILTTHAHFKNKDLLVIACDLTDINTNTIKQLIEAYQSKSNPYDCFVFSNEEEYEPLLAIYTSKALAHIYRMHAEKQLKKISMKHILDISNTYKITLKEEQKKEFKNYNTPGDLLP